MEAEHAVPRGAVVVHAKICESCGCMMFVQNGDRYCACCLPQFSTADESLFSTFFAEALEEAWKHLLKSNGRETYS